MLPSHTQIQARIVSNFPDKQESPVRNTESGVGHQTTLNELAQDSSHTHIRALLPKTEQQFNLATTIRVNLNRKERKY